MPNESFAELTQKGIAAAENGDCLLALVHLDSAAALGGSPLLDSYLGYCRARVHGEMQKGAALCRQALRLDPNHPVLYLNLGRLYLLAGQRSRAIETFRQGLRRRGHPQLMRELKGLGLRRPPVLPFLLRGHPVNKYLGLLLKRVGLR